MRTAKFKVSASEFHIYYRDTWGNAFVACPVCKNKYKEDGCVLHIIALCKKKDANHCQWIAENSVNSTMDTS